MAAQPDNARRHDDARDHADDPRPGRDHAHHHGHDHAKGHAHGLLSADAQGRAFIIGIALNLGFVIAEATFGVTARSTALLADAGHNLSDVLGLAMSWGALRLAQRAPTPRFTYGLRASSILAALFNGMVLLVACGALALEAVQRLARPAAVAGETVTLVAIVGIVVNLGTAMLFARGAKADLNVRGAFLHMAGDAAVSAAVAVAGYATLRTGWRWIDPATSLIVLTVILAGTWGLLREALAMALHAVPTGIDPLAVTRQLLTLPDIVAIHHLHIWPMSTTETALTAHLVASGEPRADIARLGAHEMAERFGIGHCTFQVERGEEALCGANS